MMHAPKIIHSTDIDGTPIVQVEMTNRPGWFAIVDRIDFEDLLLRGVSRRWFVNCNGRGQEYVRFGRSDVPGKLGSIAPLIMRPGQGLIVTYRNGNRLDLRRRNLVLASGNANGARAPIERMQLAA